MADPNYQTNFPEDQISSFWTPETSETSSNPVQRDDDDDVGSNDDDVDNVSRRRRRRMAMTMSTTITTSITINGVNDDDRPGRECMNAG